MREAAIAAGKNGFVVTMQRHLALFYRRSDTLVITFDNMKSRDAKPPVYPWAHDFLEQENLSHLGIMMTRRNDWFRHEDLPYFFARIRGEGFFRQFRRIVLYGSSMGGYGALAYAGAVPGCQVVAFSPQTSLDPALVPFETRYRQGYRRGDWDGVYADGAEGAQAARQVVVIADPYVPEDAAHIARLDQRNLVFARTPWQGHNPARKLMMAGILREVVLKAFSGDMTEDWFRTTYRGARWSQSLIRETMENALERGHPQLVLRTIGASQAHNPEWKFPNIRRRAQQILQQPYREAAE